MGMHIRRIQRRTRLQRQRTSMRGFSMVEMMIVVALLLIVTRIAFVNIQGALKDSRVNGAYDTAFMQMRVARERAITERKRYIVTFGTPAPALALTPLGAPTTKSIQVYRWDAGTPSPAPVQVSTINLPADVAFQAIAGLPTSSSAVPDGFGSGITAIDFDQGVGAGGGNLVMFMPDGSAHDLAGNFDSGILYVARNGDLSSTRAMTVFGTSGRIRGWRITFPGGVATWSQQ
jgi:prepilin-type N-terminal cleavage/methylation domain-containing protein